MDTGNDIEQIWNEQKQYFMQGTTVKYAFRRQALERLQKALEQFQRELEAALYADLHKSASESYMAELGLVKTELQYMRSHLQSFMRAKRVRPAISQIPAGTFSLAEPYGVVLIMAPWNYPVLLCLEPLIDALAAGNCVMLKPSAYAPHVSAVLRKLLESVFPRKYVAVIEGGREANGQLLEQRFDYIFFTGGVEVGKLVLRKAAENLTPVTLELGGKSPCIVDETAELAVAARRIAFGKLLNCGQTCVAPDYLVVHKSVKEQLVKLLAEQLTRMERGDALRNPDYPRMINEKHFRRVLGLMEGEKIAAGGRYDAETLQIEPTLLDAVTLASPIMQEEIFGPVLPILTYGSREELREIILHFEKPLAFYLFTGSREMRSWALKTFSFGGGCINDTILHLASSRMAFGGVGASGMGCYHGRAGFETFSHRKSIARMPVHLDDPLRYQPYGSGKDRLLKLFLR